MPFVLKAYASSVMLCIFLVRDLPFQSLTGDLHSWSEAESTPQVARGLDVAISTFCSGLPPIRNAGELGEIAPPSGAVVPVNPRLVLIHILPHVASLILHQHGADTNARHRCGVATQGMNTVIMELTEPDWAELFVGIGVSKGSTTLITC